MTLTPPRILIREAVRARLVQSLPTLATHIHLQRATPPSAAKLPAILIYSRDERIEDQPNADPGLRYRKLDLAIEITAKGDRAADEADRLAQVVEASFESDETLGLLVEGTRLTRTEVAQDGDGEEPVLGLRLSFEVAYWTKPAEAPEGTLPLQILVSQTPDIGITHEQDYRPVGVHHA